jgi:hypothetical protein
MNLIATKPLYRGRNRFIQPGQEFAEPNKSAARQLLNEGKATLSYETKVVQPEAPAVASDHPFRHGYLPDPQPSRVGEESDRVFSPADFSIEGAADRKRRRTGGGSRRRAA